MIRISTMSLARSCHTVVLVPTSCPACRNGFQHRVSCIRFGKLSTSSLDHVFHSPPPVGPRKLGRIPLLTPLPALPPSLAHHSHLLFFSNPSNPPKTPTLLAASLSYLTLRPLRRHCSKRLYYHLISSCSIFNTCALLRFATTHNSGWIWMNSTHKSRCLINLIPLTTPTHNGGATVTGFCTGL